MENDNLNQGQMVTLGKEGNVKMGEIQSKFIQNTTIEIEGKTYETEATAERPAYLIKTDDQKHVIKHADEIFLVNH